MFGKILKILGGIALVGAIAALLIVLAPVIATVGIPIILIVIGIVIGKFLLK